MCRMGDSYISCIAYKYVVPVGLDSQLFSLLKMALNLFSLSPSCSMAHLPLRNGPQLSITNMRVSRPIRCTLTVEPSVTRRTATYQPGILDHDFVQSLSSSYKSDAYVHRIDALVKDARYLFYETNEPIAQLELIGSVDRLVLAYRFEGEIKEALDTISKPENVAKTKNDLYATALRFRLLRQYGYDVSPDVFKGFVDEKGCFKATLREDVKGMLSLYEASYLAFDDEAIMDEARAFTIKHLKDIKESTNPNLAKQVAHALELPLRYTDVRLEGRWYIDEVYEKEEHMKPCLLQLAKLDYNRVQAHYQTNIKDMHRWWKDAKTMQKMPFIRDRIVECFLLSFGVANEPQFQYCRDEGIKVIQLDTMLDDIYDTYGSLKELEVLTVAFERWCPDAIENLPEYMKISYMLIFNTCNALAYKVLTEQGVDISPCLRKAWVDITKAYIQESRWYHSGYTPTFKEYLDNAWTSIGGPLILTHCSLSMGFELTKEALNGIKNRHNLMKWSSTILRLCNDVGTSKWELKRGDVAKSIECYMHEKGVDEAAARAYVRHCTDELWKKLNRACVEPSPFPRAFINGAVGLAQMSETVYQYGDGFGRPQDVTKDRAMKILAEPISIEEAALV